MVPIHLVKGGGEQHSKEYREKNPMGQLPALYIDGHLLTQSLAIIEYLNETHPEAKLLPVLPAERAKVRMISEMINSGIQPIQNLSTMLYHSQDRGRGQSGQNIGSLRDSGPSKLFFLEPRESSVWETVYRWLIGSPSVQCHTVRSGHG